MLNHIGQTAVAAKVQNAWLRTIEEGKHTNDIYKEGVSKQNLSTTAFADAVIANLGKKPTQFPVVDYPEGKTLQLPKYIRKESQKKELMGMDLFVHWGGMDPQELAEKMGKLNNDQVELTMITNRGIKVWPDGFTETFCTDHWRCRFKPVNGDQMAKKEIIELLRKAELEGIDTIKTENLYHFNGRAAFSLGQGQ
jgi:isocitrate dehydrogenase